MGLTAETNLRLGPGSIDVALDLFPELRPLLARKAGMLSGGEQQILGLARALSGRPRLLLVDELSLGLAPKIVQRLLGALSAAAQQGTGVLLVEQHARKALAIADRGYVMSRGRCELSGTGEELLARIDDIERTYLHGPTTAHEGVSIRHERHRALVWPPARPRLRRAGETGRRAGLRPRVGLRLRAVLGGLLRPPRAGRDPYHSHRAEHRGAHPDATIRDDDGLCTRDDQPAVGRPAAGRVRHRLHGTIRAWPAPHEARRARRVRERGARSPRGRDRARRRARRRG